MVKKHHLSETITENIFREFYSSSTFIEKSAIPNEFGFQSKKTLPTKAIQTSCSMKKTMCL